MLNACPMVQRWCELEAPLEPFPAAGSGEADPLPLPASGLQPGSAAADTLRAEASARYLRRRRAYMQAVSAYLPDFGELGSVPRQQLVGQRLVVLPERYDQLVTVRRTLDLIPLHTSGGPQYLAAAQDLNERFASEYGTVPDEPALCLVTGKLLRAGFKEDNAGGLDRPIGECTRHVRSLEGNGVILLLLKVRHAVPHAPTAAF